MQRQWLDVLEETKKKKAALDSQRKEAAAAAAAETRTASTRSGSVRTSARMSTTSSSSFDSLNRAFIAYWFTSCETTERAALVLTDTFTPISEQQVRCGSRCLRPQVTKPRGNALTTAHLACSIFRRVRGRECGVEAHVCGARVGSAARGLAARAARGPRRLHRAAQLRRRRRPYRQRFRRLQLDLVILESGSLLEF